MRDCVDLGCSNTNARISKAGIKPIIIQTNYKFLINKLKGSLQKMLPLKIRNQLNLLEKLYTFWANILKRLYLHKVLWYLTQVL